MDTKPLERFARAARRQLLEQVGARLDRVLRTDSAELRERGRAVKELHEQIAQASREAIIERVAYTWFNRFCALRYMDANHYTRIGVVSPAAGFTQPEILQEAKQGHIEVDLPVDRQRVFDLLAGRLSSADAQGEAYRLLLVGACNYYHGIMPFLFERINDYTELLMPDDLLSESSILQGVRATLTPDVCQDAEVIGWLYQFYITERKDQVIGAKKPIAAEDIPAATQLFTPHWIVRYLVENSLGRLWLLNRPNSRLAEQMPYYIKPEQEETDFLRAASPEELRVCDPACGSGHMLTYAFDLLYAIYEEEGYNAPDIPRLILEKNLFGMEIDERAGALAAFALVMKAREKDRRFFRRDARPNICVLRPVSFAEGELAHEPWWQGLDEEMREALLHDLHLFREADNFGSLLRPTLAVEQIAAIRALVREMAGGRQADWLEEERRRRVLRALAQAAYLAQKYHVVVANPPYMGSGNMNDRLKRYANEGYSDSKADLFAMFIERNLDFAAGGGCVAMITMHSWMFLSSFEKLREQLLARETITTMAHLGARAFDTISGEVVSTTAFVIENKGRAEHKGGYLRLVDGNSEAEKGATLIGNRPTADNPTPPLFYRAAAADFKKIPGSPIAYWISATLRDLFPRFDSLGKHYDFRIGMATGNNEEYVRLWQEVECSRIRFDCASRIEARKSGLKWFPYAKGGVFRKWAGNEEYVVAWENDGVRLQTTRHPSGDRVWAHNFNLHNIFLPAICWTFVTSAQNGFRLHGHGFLFDSAAGLGQPISGSALETALGLLNSKISKTLLPLLNPTINMPPGYLSSLPFIAPNVIKTVQCAVVCSRIDWDASETSWDFNDLPLLQPEHRLDTMEQTYASLRQH
ncbi:MAG: BREX-1 system adenine-specific DNA-methyltransferase PglX, partial [Ardenticatenaceae bacterium]